MACSSKITAGAKKIQNSEIAYITAAQVAPGEMKEHIVFVLHLRSMHGSNLSASGSGCKLLVVN